MAVVITEEPLRSVSHLPNMCPKCPSSGNMGKAINLAEPCCYAPALSIFPLTWPSREGDTLSPQGVNVDSQTHLPSVRDAFPVSVRNAFSVY